MTLQRTEIIHPIGDVVARRGLQIICANSKCRTRIAKFRHDLLAGAPSIGLDLFEFSEGQHPDASKPDARCRKCLTPYMRDDVVSTATGTALRRKFFTLVGWIGYVLPKAQ